MAAFGAAARDSRFSGHDDAVPLPNSSLTDCTRTLDTIVASASPMNASLETEPTDTSTMLSMSEHGVRQCDLMPYWSLESDPQWSFGSLLTGNELGFDGLDFSFLNADKHPVQDILAGVPVTPGTSFSQPIAGPEFSSDPLPKVDSLVQRSWHTFCGQAHSGSVTPDDAPEIYHVDELCRRNLKDKLQTRPQHDSLPSTVFLVRWDARGRFTRRARANQIILRRIYASRHIFPTSIPYFL